MIGAASTARAKRIARLYVDDKAIDVHDLPVAEAIPQQEQQRSKRVAIYRFSAQVIGRSSGRSATAAAAYRAGVEIVDQRTGLVHDYTRRSGVEAVFIVAPESAPEWASDRSALWNAVEAIEKRKDAQLTREIQLALPHELPPEQRRSVVEGFVHEQWVKSGMVADVALHAPDRDGDDRNHHAHIMLTLRSIGPAGFGQKVREWNDKARLEGWREAWQEHVNRALELAGRSERIDHRSLVDQRAEVLMAAVVDVDRVVELSRVPEPKLGPVPTMDLRRAKRTAEPLQTERAEQWQAVREENTQRRGLLHRLRNSFRDRATEVAAVFERRYEQFTQGVQAFIAGFDRWEVANVKSAKELEFGRSMVEAERARQALHERARQAGRGQQQGLDRDDGPGMGL